MSKQTDLINIPDAITVDGSGIVNLDSTFSSGTTGGIIRLKDAGTQFGDLNEDSGNFLIASAQVDKDIIFKGNDGGSVITAMTIDMSAGGNVGIGESDPDSTLTVKGASHTNFQVKSNSESTKAFIQTVQDSDIRIGSSTNHPVSFYQNGSERLRIDSDGLKFNGDTAAANALNDYEEGNWTPVGATGFPVSLSSINASYTKVGELVSVRANFIARNDATTLYISGLPFTSSVNCAASISVSDGTSVTGERITAEGFRCFIASTISSNVAYYLEATYETNS
jgi:hypothetical protein